MKEITWDDFTYKLEFNQHLFPDRETLLQAGLNSMKSLHYIEAFLKEIQQ
ncbi:hypothetical protein [Desulfosporosinus shakirovi]|nr:hypothetical protein [Desulfosporosinus sp. SRJS8]MCB8818764.1 hypothetical protein [Desulfosporosinus sp. SRJS8]